jgi:hypothetical protein
LISTRTAGRWPPLMLTTPTPLSWEIFCAMRVSASPRPGQRHDLRGHPERQHRRIGRIDLGIDRRRRQILRHQVLRAADRRLHFLLGDVDGELRSNCSVMTEAPAELVEDIWFSPASGRTASPAVR